MSETLGQQIVIDNRGGAGSTIGARLAAKSAPDGYTILLATNATLGIAPHLQANAGYDARKDFAPIGLIGAVPSVFVVQPGFFAATLGDLVKLGKASANAIDYGSPGIGTVNHLAGELLAIRAGIKLRHVPYRGAAPALNDLLGGHIPLLVSAIPNVHGQIAAGTLRALALTSAKRSGLLPQVPTVAESGFPDFDMTLTYGLVAPAGTPRAVVARLNTALNAALAAAEVKTQVAREGAEPTPTTPDEFAAIIARDETKWAALIKAIGLKP
jgi:tripartite-type tricarboxylate transporter receptor subunit TctC